MELLIISGLSGAGKSRVAAVLEDMNFYCVDNMPVDLMPKFAELCMSTRGRYERVALVTDVRSWENYNDLFKALDKMREMGCDHKILFIEASPEAIIKRYKETRRRHPLDPDGRNFESAVKREMKMLEYVREKSDYIINTTNLSLGQLQRKLYDTFMGEYEEKNMKINVISFGFKYGIPIDADLVFDVRFLPNPYYEPDLKEKSGLDQEIKDYIFKYDCSNEFMKHLNGLMEFLIPNYIEEGKHFLEVGIGCTGGRHRSVAVACALADFISSKGYQVECSHRDIDMG